MSNFWSMSDGKTAEQSSTYESGGGDLEPIPNKTGCIAAIEEAKWDMYEGDRFITLKWRVARPDAYKNRVLFQKIKVFGTSKDKDPVATADKAKRMLAAIDTNAGGKLMKLGAEPSDTDLMSALMGKLMAIKVMVWEMDDKKGNWISAVAPAGKSAPAPQEVPMQAAAPVQAQSAAGGSSFDDDIPFASVSRHIY